MELYDILIVFLVFVFLSIGWCEDIKSFFKRFRTETKSKQWYKNEYVKIKWELSSKDREIEKIKFDAKIKYNRINNKLIEAERKISAMNVLLDMILRGDKINSSENDLSIDDLKQIRRFIHPDKHGENNEASKLTAKINSMIRGS